MTHGKRVWPSRNGGRTRHEAAPTPQERLNNTLDILLPRLGRADDAVRFKAKAPDLSGDQIATLASLHKMTIPEVVDYVLQDGVDPYQELKKRATA